jgi:hypothetical protein
MEWLDWICYFFGGTFFTNAVPHVVSGLMGRPFQSPFAKPRGRGLSSPVVNVLWGFLNLVAGYGLIFHVGNFNVRSIPDVVSMGSGSVSIGLILAWFFGRVNGGNSPKKS